MPPLTLRATPEAIYLVGTAAGPLGGDRLTLDIDVGDEATLEVRSAAASIALPGADPRPSRMIVRARVGEHATLRWLPEPSIAAAGCNHSISTRLALAPTARVLWREEIVLGRHDEEPGTWRTRLSADIGGQALLRHGLDIGPDGFDGPAILDGAKAVGSLLEVDPYRTFEPMTTSRSAIFVLARSGALTSVMADDALELRRLLEQPRVCRRRSAEP